LLAGTKLLKWLFWIRVKRVLDTLIIGAGPAGLMAATYLGRFHRKPLVIDGNASRARWIPKSHNIPGFERGIGGDDLLRHLRDHAGRYGAEIRAGQVTSVTRGDAGFRIEVGSETLLSRYVILATGVRDQLPGLDGAEEAVRGGLLRICPICDAFEATGKRIAVIGDGEHGDREAEFLRTYSERVTLIDLSGGRRLEAKARVRSSGIRILERQLSDLRIEENTLVLRSLGGPAESFDVFYSALGCQPQNQLAAALGVELDEKGAVRVSRHQLTSVAGLYAIGDLVRGLNQVVVAAAEAAIAATDIHNQLRGAAQAKQLAGS
jgi:thioredoxin reductase (NADPH)